MIKLKLVQKISSDNASVGGLFSKKTSSNERIKQAKK
jgi:hypothetical protein